MCLFSLPPVIVFKLNFKLLVCLQGTIISSLLSIYYLSIYRNISLSTNIDLCILQKVQGRMRWLDSGWGGRCEILRVQTSMPLPLLILALWACVGLQQREETHVGAGTGIKMMIDTVTFRCSRRRIKYKTGSPPQPGVNFASFCPLNGPTAPASRPLSPPSLHLIRSAGLGVPLIRPIRL